MSAAIRAGRYAVDDDRRASERDEHSGCFDLEPARPRCEPTITGGASSVYGADAMAGVVNFILKKDYEGVDFDVRYGETMEGDGAEMRIAGVYGANFADDEGNVLMGFEYSQREARSGRVIAAGSVRSGRIGPLALPASGPRRPRT